MITEYEKFRMQDLNKKNDWFVEVNWKEDESIKDSQVLKVTFPNGDVAYTQREILNTMLFAIGRPDDQKKMIPQKITRSRWYETVLSVKALKDIAKGENISFPVKISLPSVEEEVVAEIKKKKLGSGLWVPKRL